MKKFMVCSKFGKRYENLWRDGRLYKHRSSAARIVRDNQEVTHVPLLIREIEVSVCKHCGHERRTVLSGASDKKEGV